MSTAACALPGCALGTELGLAVEHGGNLLETSHAVLSARTDARYRYYLAYVWHDALPLVTWVMLNPSTATAHVRDQTMRSCVRLARALGFGGLAVLNLYAWRATKPRELWTAPDPIGPANERFLVAGTRPEATRGGPVVAAWGNHGARDERSTQVIDLLRRHGVALQRLGLTNQGEPRHPLYMKTSARLVPHVVA